MNYFNLKFLLFVNPKTSPQTMTFDVEDVLAQLTVDEKIGLTSGTDYWHTFPVHRLNVPSVKTSDGPNGIRGAKHFNSTPTACFPVETALGSTWDIDLIHQVGKRLDQQARAKLCHIILGPTLNIQRIPNGGRGFESFAEDPVLAGELAAAYINGFQEDGLAATLKHYVCNDQENDRFASDSIVTERALREIYLKAFEVAIAKSYPKAIMTSYNRVNGVHVSENAKLLNEILRKEWGWKGLVMSDWTGTYSSSEAINAGLDLEMPGPTRWRGPLLRHDLLSKKILPETLHERARNVLNLVKSVEDANIPEDIPENGKNIPEQELLTKEDKEVLRRAAGESAVLLKNDGDILPFNKKTKTLVIGPNASYAAYSGGGSALATPSYTVTPLSAIQEKLGHENVDYEIGAYNHLYLPNLKNELFLEEHPSENGAILKISNESFEDPNRDPFEILTFKDISYFRMNDYVNPKLKSSTFFIEIVSNFVPTHSGTYEFGIAVCGTAKLFLDSNLVIDNSKDQILGDSFYGMGTVEVKGTYKVTKGQTYKLKIEFGSAATSEAVRGKNPTFSGGGGLTFGGVLLIDPETAIEQASARAKEYDQVLIITGLNKDYESEGADRAHLKIPGLSNKMIESVVEANARTVVWIQSGTPVEMPWANQVSSLVWSSYGGNETGNGIADVLFGDINFSGKLPLSFPVRFEDTPSFVNNTTDNGKVLYGEDIYVGYRYYEKVKRGVLFPFGHGLSYSDFKLSNLNVTIEETLRILVQVTNSSKVAGSEVVQVYIGANTSRVQRPVKELKAFKKVKVSPNSTASVEIELDIAEATSFWDTLKSKWASEAGTYTVHVGNSSDTTLKANFDVRESNYYLKKIVN